MLCKPAWRRHTEAARCDLKMLHGGFQRHHRDFLRYHRYFRYARPAVLVFNLIILVLLFRWAGLKAAGIFLATLIVVKEIALFIFLMRLEKRIIFPIQELRRGVEEIGRGNYAVHIECNIPNDLGLLIASFNEMAEKLLESEQIKAEYEDNRKTLVANISHDLKTPITAMRGYLEMLMEGTVVPPEKRDQYLKIIHSNVSYLNHLVDDLFLFSKLDMQKLELVTENVCIRNYIRDLMEEYKLELEGRKIDFSFDDALPDNPLISMDGKRIYQAINNIVRNAIGHGPEQGLALQVKLYRKDDWIALDIEDNGPGIAEDKLPLIFDRFYRVDPQRTKRFESTGLGLAIAKELVLAHGGEISVSSREGEGTSFSIMLPEITDGEGNDEISVADRG